MTERIYLTSPTVWTGPGPSTAQDPSSSHPTRPPRWQERFSHQLLLFLSPRVARKSAPATPQGVDPYFEFDIERSGDRGTLAARWFPAFGQARGAVLLIHPWHRAGQRFFFRHGRLRALREAGYHALTFDLGGFGQSGPSPTAYYDTDLEDALGALRQQADGLPLHVWGVSAGGYWAHILLSRLGGVSGAIFEDVSPHLIEWSRRMAPWGLPFYLFFQHILPLAYRFLDLRNHAPNLRIQRAAYIGGELDRSISAHETQELARLACAPALLVEGADHLRSVKQDHHRVIQLALETFEEANRTTRSHQVGG